MDFVFTFGSAPSGDAGLLAGKTNISANMPDWCCAYGCSNKRTRGGNLSFYRIPAARNKESLALRKKWIAAIRRANWTEKQIDNARLCSAHFISGKKSMDPSHPDYVPSVFNFRKVRQVASKQKMARYKRLQERMSTGEVAGTSFSTLDVEGSSFSTLDVEGTSFSTLDVEQPQDSQTLDFEESGHENKDTQTDCHGTEIDNLKRKLALAGAELLISENKLINPSIAKKPMTYSFIEKDEGLINFYTGLPNNQLFLWFLALFKDKVQYKCTKLSVNDHLLLILMKLKLGLLNQDIAFRFEISESLVSRVFRRWLPVMSAHVKFLIVWPQPEALRKYLPSCFRSNFQNLTCIIDCTEIYIERPLNLTARAQTWSNYKNTNTIKYLIGITPTGSVSFLSAGWGGRTSDKEITLKSGFLEMLKTGDMVMADREFPIQTELATRGAILKIPKFTRGKKQMPAQDVDYSRTISNVRIHVERVIGRLRKFAYLQSRISISQVDLLDEAMIVISSIININKRVVS